MTPNGPGSLVEELSLSETQPTAGTIAASSGTSVPVDSFVTGAGQVTSQVFVRMSLTVIERFSRGLYSSPNKAFEELVSNSYDAGAKRVWVAMPDDLAASEAKIVVVDDGDSMDLAGLQDLWQIGESHKRDSASEASRQPIGKFGIGKLATFVLATRLTYITYRENCYLAVTMDYNEVRGEMADPQQMTLQVAKINREQARRSLQDVLGNTSRRGEPLVENDIRVDEAPADDPEASPLDVLFDGSTQVPSWTAAVMTRLKPAATEIRLGRLRWILRTAIPLNPNFRLWFNGWQLTSSKIDKPELWSFVIGKNEGELGQPDRIGTPSDKVMEDGTTVPTYVLPTAGAVWGEAKLYESSLQQGKSDLLGRSHGFFVRVRRRLINIDDPTFDVGPELSHGVFTRLNMVIDADGLDDYVAAPRESLQESPALKELKQYMLAVFNRARAARAQFDTQDPLPLLSKQGRLTDPPAALTQGPFRRMLQRAVSNRDQTRGTLGLRIEHFPEAERLLRAGDDLIESVIVAQTGDDERLVGYDPHLRAAVVNQDHPFVANYLDVRGALEPLKLVALAELLTEAYMLDESISAEQVSRVMRRRDAFLKGLVERYPRSAFVVAAQLRSASNNEKRLEDAVADALEILGFDVQRIGGNGTPDGVATARLGWRSTAQGSESYALTYDAKSSGAAAKEAVVRDEEGLPIHVAPIGKAPRIQAGTTHTSILRVHRERATQDFSLAVEPTETLLVAPDFQGFDEEDSTIGAICANDNITPVRVEDLALLVELFPFRLISPTTLRSFFRLRHPMETARWIGDRRADMETQASVLPLVTAILEDYSERKSPVSVPSLTTALFERTGDDYAESEVEAVVRGLAALVPKCLFFDGSVVALNTNSATLYSELGKAIAPIDDVVAHAMKMAISGVGGSG